MAFRSGNLPRFDGSTDIGLTPGTRAASSRASSGRSTPSRTASSGRPTAPTTSRSARVPSSSDATTWAP